MKFEVEITDIQKLAGIAAARDAYNAALPDQSESATSAVALTAGKLDGTPAVAEQRTLGPKPGALSTDQAYVQFVMDRAVESYSKQYNT